jgi:hypothetical protein
MLRDQPTSGSPAAVPTGNQVHPGEGNAQGARARLNRTNTSLRPSVRMAGCGRSSAPPGGLVTDTLSIMGYETQSAIASNTLQCAGILRQSLQPAASDGHPNPKQTKRATHGASCPCTFPRVRIVNRITHLHTRARARARTHTHTHTHTQCRYT